MSTTTPRKSIYAQRERREPTDSEMIDWLERNRVDVHNAVDYWKCLNKVEPTWRDAVKAAMGL